MSKRGNGSNGTRQAMTNRGQLVLAGLMGLVMMALVLAAYAAVMAPGSTSPASNNPDAAAANQPAPANEAVPANQKVLYPERGTNVGVTAVNPSQAAPVRQLAGQRSADEAATTYSDITEISRITSEKPACGLECGLIH